MQVLSSNWPYRLDNSHCAAEHRNLHRRSIHRCLTVTREPLSLTKLQNLGVIRKVVWNVKTQRKWLNHWTVCFTCVMEVFTWEQTMKGKERRRGTQTLRWRSDQRRIPWGSPKKDIRNQANGSSAHFSSINVKSRTRSSHAKSVVLSCFLTCYAYSSVEKGLLHTGHVLEKAPCSTSVSHTAVALWQFNF